jgi:ankyrin repeat protein
VVNKVFDAGKGSSVLSLLLDAGADVETVIDDGSGDTLLIRAARNGNARDVALLLARGANPKARNAEKLTALDIARRTLDARRRLRGDDPKHVKPYQDVIARFSGHS